MKAVASDRASAIFFALSGVPLERRAQFLDEHCGGDTALRSEVERLLGSVDAAESVVSPLERDGSIRYEGISLSPGTVVADFVVVRQIGAGGTGVVHLAHQLHPPRVVALKVLRREFLASVVQRRFEIEAELLAQLQHPGIAHIYAAHPGDETTPPFIAMELVNGPPITEYADAHKLSVRARIELLAGVCDAVQHAHQRGVIHRDLKPGNILVGQDGQPKVLDFGVARRMDVESAYTSFATETGQLVGTLAYMSPEQVQALPGTIDTRTDIHALGVILFRLLAGRLPFAHGDPSLPELARRIVEDEPTRLGSVDPSLKGDLEIIAARAMAKEKERRYPSAAGLAADLRRFLAGNPISASADSAWYLVRRQIGRYRLALATSAATVAIVAVLGVYAAIQRNRAAASNVLLENQLSTSTVERGRLVSLTGNHPVAEELVWKEFFHHPDSRHAQWALWDIYSREPSLWTRFVHETGTQTIRFSPDNRLLLTAGRLDGELQLLQADSGQLVRRFVAEPRSGVLRGLFGHGGSTIVSGHADGTIRVWDTSTGALRREIRTAMQGLRDLALAGDGDLAVAVASGAVHVWSLTAGQALSGFSGLVEGASTVAVEPLGTLAAVGSADGNLTTIDLARRTRRWQVHAHDTEVISVAVSPQARVIVSGSVNGFVRSWRPADGALIRSITSENGRVRNLSFDAAGVMLAAAGQWRTRIWNVEDPSATPRDLGGAEGMTDVHLRPDGKAMATCNGGSGQVRMWDLSADSRLAHWPGHRGPVTGLLLGDAARSVITTGSDGTVTTRSIDDSAGSAVLLRGEAINTVDLSRDKRWLITVGTPAAAAVWDLRSGSRAADLQGVRGSRAVTFADEDRRIVVGEGDGTLKAFEWSPGRAIPAWTIPPSNTQVTALGSWGTRVFAADANRHVVVRDVADGREVRRFQASSVPFSVATTPDGRLLAAGTYLGTVELWDPEQGVRQAELKGQTALVTSIDISPDRTLLAASSRDGSIRLWNLEGQSLATIAVRKVGATRVRFFPDGRRLAIGYDDGEVEVRDLEYFFRYAAGQVEYQRQLLRQTGELLPRAQEVVEWGRRILSPVTTPTR